VFQNRFVVPQGDPMTKHNGVMKIVGIRRGAAAASV
jgi:hypothetical protein